MKFLNIKRVSMFALALWMLVQASLWGGVSSSVAAAEAGAARIQTTAFFNRLLQGHMHRLEALFQAHMEKAITIGDDEIPLSGPEENEAEPMADLDADMVIIEEAAPLPEAAQQPEPPDVEADAVVAPQHASGAPEMEAPAAIQVEEISIPESQPTPELVEALEEAVLPTEAEAGDAAFHAAYEVVFLNVDGSALHHAVVPEGSEVHLPPAPEREGYTFLYWHITDDPGTPYEAATPVVRDVTLSPMYSENAAPQTPQAEPWVELCFSYVSDAEDGSLVQGSIVTITAVLHDFPEDSDLMLQWQNNAGGAFEDVPGATGLSYSFAADAQNTGCSWALKVMDAGVEKAAE